MTRLQRCEGDPEETHTSADRYRLLTLMSASPRFSHQSLEHYKAFVLYDGKLQSTHFVNLVKGDNTLIAVYKPGMDLLRH